MIRPIPLHFKIIAAVGLVMALLLILANPGFAAPSESPSSASVIVHWVRWGETLSGIGMRYGVSAWTIARYNGIRNPNCIYAGQRLLIPVRYVTCCPAYRPVYRPVYKPACGYYPARCSGVLYGRPY